MSSSLVFLLGVTVSALGQQPAAPLTLRPATAQMVLVDAYVTDRKGRPVTDLQRDDFELLEDDERVTIGAFIQPRRPAVDGGATPPMASARAETPVPDQEPMTLILYVDRRLLSPGGRKRALDQAFTLVESHLAQGARAVVIADDNGLRPLTPLTKDPAIVRAALTRIQGWATSSPSVSDARSTVENIKAVIMSSATSQCDCACLLPQILQVVRGYATFRTMEAQETSNRLAFLVNALLGLSGRKAFVYVSEGLEERPGIQLYDQIFQVCPQALTRDAPSIYAAMQEFETSRTFQEVTARANAARVTFYPIDARGLTGLSSADISQSDPTLVPNARNDMIKDANLKAPLQLLGEETGGFAMLNGLDPRAAMKRFDADEQGHYVLGFVPGEADGKIHKLWLRLTEKARARRHADVRHRLSYLRAELPARRGQRSLSTLLFGLEENALDARVEVERASVSLARVHIFLSLGALKAGADGTANEARVQVVVSFRSTQGEARAITVREKDVTFNLTEDERLGNADRREIVIEVPVDEGAYEFAVGVEDLASGGTSYLRRSLEAAGEK
jgi:VWFA-related protein